MSEWNQTALCIIEGPPALKLILKGSFPLLSPCPHFDSPQRRAALLWLHVKLVLTKPFACLSIEMRSLHKCLCQILYHPSFFRCSLMPSFYLKLICSRLDHKVIRRESVIWISHLMHMRRCNGSVGTICVQPARSGRGLATWWRVR